MLSLQFLDNVIPCTAVDEWLRGLTAPTVYRRRGAPQWRAPNFDHLGIFNMPPNLKYRHFHFVPLESAPACSRLLDMGGWPLPLLFPLKLKCFYHHLHQKGGRGGWELNLRLNSTAPQPPSHHSGCQDELTVYSRQVKLLDNFLRAVKYHEFPNIPQLRNYTSLTNQILRVACSGPLFRVRFYFVTVCVCSLHQKKKRKRRKLPSKFQKWPKIARLPENVC